MGWDGMTMGRRGKYVHAQRTPSTGFFPGRQCVLSICVWTVSGGGGVPFAFGTVVVERLVGLRIHTCGSGLQCFGWDGNGVGDGDGDHKVRQGTYI